MLVNKILNGIHILGGADLLSMDASSIASDSRNLGADCLFFAYKGANFDSHNLVAEMYAKGQIKAVVSERAVDGVPCILVANGRDAFARACVNFFDVSDKLLKIAVTGTNGKTTTTYLIESIFNAAGMKNVRIGTVGAHVVDETVLVDNTTPSPYDFHRFLADGVKKGARASVAEVSSHALEQHRIAGTNFDVAVFTNLTGDHLDYHKDFESYYQAKKRLFANDYSAKRVINIGNEYGRRLYSESDEPKLIYGINSGDLSVSEYSTDLSGTYATVSYSGETYKIYSHLTGLFNLENILAAIGAALMAGISFDRIKEGLAELKNVPGRLEKYENNNVYVFVDYAHTDDALKNVLLALKELAKGRVIVVFGAGGDRDKTKRPRMGKVASDYADFVVVTSDNPRTEKPESIIEDILQGVSKRDSLHVEADREKAIAYGIKAAEAGDIVLIAGKGHEDYQITGKEKHHFSDSEVVKKYLGV